MQPGAGNLKYLKLRIFFDLSELIIWNIQRSTTSELKTLEWDVFNPDQLINLEINNKRRTSINPDIHHSKVPSSGYRDIGITKSEFVAKNPL